MKLKIFSLALCLGMVLAGCNNMQKGAGIGAVGGAVLGGIVGKIAGNTVVGAAVGGAVGAGAGALIGKHMDKVKAEAEAVRNAEVQEVTDANGLQAVKLTFDSGIHIGSVRGLIRLWHRLFGHLERRNLCGKRPCLKLFNLYRLGYYVSQKMSAKVYGVF